MHNQSKRQNPRKKAAHSQGAHFPVAHGAPALHINQHAPAVDLAAVPPLIGETHVVLILVLDKSVSAAAPPGREKSVQDDTGKIVERGAASYGTHTRLCHPYISRKAGCVADPGPQDWAPLPHHLARGLYALTFLFARRQVQRLPTQLLIVTGTTNGLS